MGPGYPSAPAVKILIYDLSLFMRVTPAVTLEEQLSPKVYTFLISLITGRLFCRKDVAIEIPTISDISPDLSFAIIGLLNFVYLTGVM